MPINKKDTVSLSVVRRLPRYYRYLGELSTAGKNKISSKELSQIMNLTASQIRQDFNCFGGFGQQGYGYNVPALQKEIASILGIDNAKPMILVGAGNLGRAIAAYESFDSSGFKLIGIFDSNSETIGASIAGLTVQDVVGLESFCMNNRPMAAALCTPEKAAEEITGLLIQCGVRSFLNFSHFDIGTHYENVRVENVYIADSLMTLAYRSSEGAK